MKTKVTIAIIVFCLVVFVADMLALQHFSQTGTVLSLTTTRQAGTMFFDGPHKVVVNQPFTLKVMVDSNNQNINAAGFYMRFDPQKIQVNDMSTLNSFCQFYPEKKFDNRMGLVSLACGAPHPGLKGQNDLIELQITPLSIGTTTLSVSSNSKLLLSDGKGTNILTGYPSWEVQIGAGL